MRHGLTFDEFTGTRYLRINRVRELQEAGRLDDALRWQSPDPRVPPSRQIFQPTEISDVVTIDIEPRGDERGFLARTYCEHEFAEHGLVAAVAQCSTVVSPRCGTLRGLHFQESPHAEVKLVQVHSRGAVFLVMVDLRRGLTHAPRVGRGPS